MRRQGMTYRLHDYRLPRGSALVVGLDPEARRGMYDPRVFAILRWHHRRGDMTGWGPGCEYVDRYFRLEMRLPVMGWRRAYQLRRLGALRLYQAGCSLIYAIGRPA